MMGRNFLGQYASKVTGDIGLLLPVSLLILVIASGFALRWYKKKKADEYEIIEEEITPLEDSESLQAVEATIRRKTKRQ